jgi:rfaE bifunctional protein nucleotidyltransferase chain/domain
LNVDSFDDRILSRCALIALRRNLRREGKKVVFTNGCFDLLHRAHVEYLREARRLGDALLVGLNSDLSVRALKGAGRPLIPQEDRAVLLASVRWVDWVCIFDEVSVEGLITELLPDVLVKGGDYQPEQIVGRQAVLQAGGQVCALSCWGGGSTSSLLEKIGSRYRVGEASGLGGLE